MFAHPLAGVGESPSWGFEKLQNGNEDSIIQDTSTYESNQVDFDIPPTDQFPAGFSDGEEGAEAAFDRSFEAHQDGFKIRDKPALPSPGKSPRSDDSDNELIHTPKRFRKSLFGGSPLHFGNGSDSPRTSPAPQDHSFGGGDQARNGNEEVKTPSFIIRGRMSSLKLYPEDEGEGDGDDEGPVLPKSDYSFGLVNHDDSGSDSRSASPASFMGMDVPTEIRREIQADPYHLRTNINRTRSGPWFDEDQSGNFDPDKEARDIQLQRSKARERKKLRDLKKANEPNKLECIVCLKVDFSAIKPRQIPIEDPKGDVEDLTGYPEARGCKKCREQGVHCSMISGGTWPCESCQFDEEQCWPIMEPQVPGKCNHCYDCDEDEENYCSFEMGLAPHSVCRQCVEAGYTDCIPGIPEGYKTRLVDLDEIEYGPDRPSVGCTHCKMNKKRCSVKKLSDRGPCNQCKRAKIGCTFHPPLETQRSNVNGKRKGKSKVEVIDSTDENEDEEGEPSNPGQSSFESFWGDWALEDLDETLQIEKEPTPDFEMRDSEGNFGILTKIQTSFAHPIQFNFMDEDEDPDDPGCEFCNMPGFSIYGYFEQTVHVLKWENGLGCTELQGGHRENEAATTMCQRCTMARVQILCCPSHEIHPITDNTTDDGDHAESMAILMEGLADCMPRSDELMEQLKRWCSMCCSAAAFMCCASQPSLMGDGSEVLNGCGLRLCKECERRLREEFDGSSDALAKSLDAEPATPVDDPDESKVYSRADVGFLIEDGLLLRNVSTGTMKSGPDNEASGG